MKEHDIRPEALLQRYLELSALDAERCFGGISRYEVPCVACGVPGASHQFVKNGFDYASCSSCGTLFQSPRPSLAAYESFYRESDSSRYWADVFFPAVAEARRERIFRPRAERLAALCRDKGIVVERLIEVGAGYGIFLDEWHGLSPATELLAVEPSASLAAHCRAKGLVVEETIAEKLSGYDGHADIVVCFEVFEHVHDPLSFLKTLARLARPGGYVFVSTLCADGFDIQVLWEASNSIFPPHHINFLSVAGMESVFGRAGLLDVEVTTPGKLDVDIVRNAAAKQPGLLKVQRFIQKLVADDDLGAAFQTFLAQNRLSSHAWAIGRKPTEGN
jgi:SAM-dependent methyltransferase